jgi:hypothetical protein
MGSIFFFILRLSYCYSNIYSPREVDMKYIVSLDVLYREDVWVEADDAEAAADKVLAGKGIRVGLPKRCDDSLQLTEVNETNLEVD